VRRLDDSRLVVVIGACRGERNEVAVREEDDEVHLAARTDDPPHGPLCADSVEVTLDGPLGNRRVIDDFTGNEIDVQAPHG